ncbi:MAG: hypothetical protein A2138_22815, partial [Deltaproteobacteria bacterium RBG_16_71_12]
MLGACCQVVALVMAGADALRVLITAKPLSAAPIGGGLVASTLRLDTLAAVFVCALVIVGIAVALYAPDYLARGGHRMGGVAQQGLLAALEAAMLGVLVADDLVTFFVFWEVMTATATALVLADGQRAEVKRAAILYIVINHIGTLFALVGLLMLAGRGGLSFAELRAASAAGSPMSAFAVGLAVVGFATKAGVVPLHVWLPEAHPVAPSHVSALLSGVILKIGVYAMVRTALDLGGPASDLMGYGLLAFGMVSAVLGVLFALVQHDLKRLLAFHSVENIGIILLGVGLGIVANNAGLPTLASLAMAAGLFHVVNHAVFKAALFLCAGSIQLGPHTHDLEERGGLARAMPSTARSFLIAAMAISALPPLNGFASEWLILEGFIASNAASSFLLRAAAPFLAAGLALTGALAAACFVKAFAVAFLALPRSAHAEHAVEAPRSCRAAQTGLAAVCVVLGLGAPWVIAVVSRAAAPLGWSVLPLTASASLGGVAGVGLVQPIWLAGIGVLLAVPLALALRRAPARTAQTWACGLGGVEGRAAYTASAFANPIRRIFAGIYQLERATEPVEGVAPYFVTRSRTHAA